MNRFKPDPRLEKDCLNLGVLDFSQLLLMNNSLLPWFILLPQTSETELIDLSPVDQLRLLEEINLLSDFIREHFEITKLNIAAIGNIVSQLHIHVVGRDPSDYCWPDVVWGTRERQPYTTERIDEITVALCEQFRDKFIANETK